MTTVVDVENITCISTEKSSILIKKKKKKFMPLLWRFCNYVNLTAQLLQLYHPAVSVVSFGSSSKSFLLLMDIDSWQLLNHWQLLNI